MPMPNEKLPEIIVFDGPNGSGKMNNLFGRISIGMKCLCGIYESDVFLPFTNEK